MDPSERGIFSWGVALAISLVANAVLFLHDGQEPPAADHPTPMPEVAAEKPPGSAEKNVAQQAGKHWSEIESADFTEFAENLRRLGCPDDRIADLLVPEIQTKLRREMCAVALQVPRDRRWDAHPAWKALAGDAPEFEGFEDDAFWTYLKKIEAQRDEMLEAVFGNSFNDRGDEWKDWPYALR